MLIREIAQNFNNFCQKCIPPLSEFSHCFCPNFGKKAMGNSGKKRRHIFRGKIIIAFARISHCFFPNFPWLLPEFSIAFSPRISYCFCPNFPLLLPEFSVFKNWRGALPCPPPRLLRLWVGGCFIFYYFIILLLRTIWEELCVCVHEYPPPPPTHTHTHTTPPLEPVHHRILLFVQV